MTAKQQSELDTAIEGHVQGLLEFALSARRTASRDAAASYGNRAPQPGKPDTGQSARRRADRRPVSRSALGPGTTLPLLCGAIGHPAGPPQRAAVRAACAARAT